MCEDKKSMIEGTPDLRKTISEYAVLTHIIEVWKSNRVKNVPDVDTFRDKFYLEASGFPFTFGDAEDTLVSLKLFVEIAEELLYKITGYYSYFDETDAYEVDPELLEVFYYVECDSDTYVCLGS